jgi:hypothetical protein
MGHRLLHADCADRAGICTDSAPTAVFFDNEGFAIFHLNGIKRTNIQTGFTAGALFRINYSSHMTSPFLLFRICNEFCFAAGAFFILKR